MLAWTGARPLEAPSGCTPVGRAAREGRDSDPGVYREGTSAMEEVTINAETEDEGTEDEGTVVSSGADLSTLGDNIESTVQAAAGDDDAAEAETEDDGADDGGSTGGDVSADTTLTLDDTPGASIADASGGDNNF